MTVEKPCAVAYVRMKIKEGLQVHMEDIPDEVPEEAIAEAGGITTVKKIRIAVARKK